MMEWEKKDDKPVRLKYKIVLNGARAPKKFLRLVLEPQEGIVVLWKMYEQLGQKK